MSEADNKVRGQKARLSKLAVVSLVVLLSCCTLSGCKDSKNSKPNSANMDGNLHLRLETDFSKSEFSLGEPVIVHMYLKNNTDKDIVICAWPSREELVFTHYEDNKPVVYRDTALFDRPVSKDKSFVTIKPGVEIHYSSSGFGEEWQEEFPSQYFDKVGRWELRIIHFHDFTGERFGLSGWQGKLSSNVLSINIVPKIKNSDK